MPLFFKLLKEYESFSLSFCFALVFNYSELFSFTTLGVVTCTHYWDSKIAHDPLLRFKNSHIKKLPLKKSPYCIQCVGAPTHPSHLFYFKWNLPVVKLPWCNFFLYLKHNRLNLCREISSLIIITLSNSFDLVDI